MPIAALPEKAARALCSTLVLSDPCSVIKELIDNALDARATNILIEIAANTLDIIQVRDNGTGIGVEDRRLLCKRGFTSKIRTIEDLAQLGGKFLGFRGEALASIAELSEDVSCTTRVDGETVGTQLKFDCTGKPLSSSSASHPTGTTIRVSHFLQNVPVRKQTALKQAAKTLARIKSLLFDYAFARPTVKLQFRVLRSTSESKDNWSFVPCKDDNNLVLLASKVVGKEAASQCHQVSISSVDGATTIDALLVKRDADLSKTGGNGHFCSVDGRPLTAGRGLMNNLHSIYISYLQHHICQNKNQAGNQFLLLRLQSPSGSYDVNVEPAKTEVIFENGEEIKTLFEDMCKRLYGAKLEANDTRTPTKSPQGSSHPTGFDVFLARKPAIAASTAITQSPYSMAKAPRGSPSEALSMSRHDSMGIGNLHKSTSYDGDQGIPHEASQSIQDTPTDDENFEDPEDDIMNPRITNHFTLAKLNTRLKPSITMLQIESSRPPVSEPVESRSEVEDARDSSTSPADTSNGRQVSRPSPSVSPDQRCPYQNPGPPNRPWKPPRSVSKHQAYEVSDSPAMQFKSSHPILLETWAQGNNSSPASGPQSGLVEVSRSEVLSKQRSSFPNPAQWPRETSQRAKSAQESGPPKQKPFCIPIKRALPKGSYDKDRLLPNLSLTPVSLKVGQRETELQNERVHDRSSLARADKATSPAADLNEIMAFEHRKRDVVQQYRDGLRRSGKMAGSVNLQEENVPMDYPTIMHKQGVTVQLAPEPEQRPALWPNVAEDPEQDSPQPKSLSCKQNPYWNRFGRWVQDHHQSLSERGSGQDSTRVTSLQRDDPRIYLIDMQRPEQYERTGKGRHARTAKLPFEAVNPASATFSFIAHHTGFQSDNIPALRRMVRKIGKHDEYVRRGFVPVPLKMPGSLAEVSADAKTKLGAWFMRASQQQELLSPNM